MATLYLIRHGEPELRGTFLGQSDPPLSLLGHQQADRALSRLTVEAAYVSPLRRARETAGYLKTAQTIVPELREIDFGDWTGRTWNEIETGWPEIAREKEKDWLSIAAPGGESWDDLLLRLRPMWNFIRSNRSSTTAVVAHAGVNAALAYIIDNRSPYNFSQNYAEVTELQYDNA